jgi:hypothetical protein
VETRVAGATREVIIGGVRPTVLIGERINPTGKKRLAEALRAGDLSVVREEALAQVAAGADILDVNVGATGVDEVVMLPLAIKAVCEVVDVPLCLDSRNIEALRAALDVCPGRPIVNSVTGEEASLLAVLALVKERGVPVIGLTLDEKGIPADADSRVVIARRIVERAEAHNRLSDPVAGGQCQSRSGDSGGHQAGAGRAGLQSDPRVQQHLARAAEPPDAQRCLFGRGHRGGAHLPHGGRGPGAHGCALHRLGARSRQLRHALHQGLPRGGEGG